VTHRVLITGATSGIGLQLVRRFAGRADILATGMRSEADANTVLPAGLTYLQTDQADPEACAATITEFLDQLGWQTLDLAILNAGSGAVGPAETEDPQVLRRMLAINLLSPMLLAHALFAPLARTNGKLVLVGSTARKGANGFASYAAAKAGLHGFGRALNAEWQGRVSVQTIHPGPTRTEMHARAGFDAGRLARWFLSPVTVAAMMEDIMRSGKPCANADHLRLLASPRLWRSVR
jgi:NAD(P)-dependent dehydrogenase (short-subunit alcohol dehydrogenase family)